MLFLGSGVGLGVRMLFRSRTEERIRRKDLPALAGAVLFMGVGVWLHPTERNERMHMHEALEHAHRPCRDEQHRHEPLRHAYPHCPDLPSPALRDRGRDAPG